MGYTVRLESRVSPRTRIEVVTEGVLIRRLQRDPSLPGAISPELVSPAKPFRSNAQPPARRVAVRMS